MLKLNMPKALASVPVELICKWEHRARRLIDAYAEGLDACSAQLKVKAQKYKSQDGFWRPLYEKWTFDHIVLIML